MRTHPGTRRLEVQRMAYKESEDARMEVMEVQKAWSGPHDHGGQRFWMNVTDPQVRQYIGNKRAYMTIYRVSNALI